MSAKTRDSSPVRSGGSGNNGGNSNTNTNHNGGNVIKHNNFPAYNYMNMAAAVGLFNYDRTHCFIHNCRTGGQNCPKCENLLIRHLQWMEQNL